MPVTEALAPFSEGDRIELIAPGLMLPTQFKKFHENIYANVRLRCLEQNASGCIQENTMLGVYLRNVEKVKNGRIDMDNSIMKG